MSDPSGDLDLLDLAHTAGARRGHHDHRLALVVSSRDEIVEALDAFRRGEPHLSSIAGRRLSGRRPRTVFVFSGHGGLWQGAGRALFDREPSFRAAIERCDSILSRHLGWSPAAELRASRSSSRIGDPAVDQPVQFALQVALAALWKSWGIVPERSVGDGIGEVTAAYVAGSLSLEDAATIIARGQADAASPPRWLPSTPRFPEAIGELAREGFEVFLEVGPHPVLASTIKESLGPRGASALVLPSLRRGDAGSRRSDGRPPSSTRRASTSSGHGSRPLAVSSDFRAIPGSASDSGSTTGTTSLAPARSGHATERTARRAQGIIKTASQMATLRPRWNDMRLPWRSVPSPPRAPDHAPRDCRGPIGRFSCRGPLGLSTEVRRERLIEYFRDRVAAVLGMTPDKVDPDRPLLTMGLDSLTAMDLKVEIETSLGMTLPLSILLEGATIRELAEQAADHGAGPSNGPSEPAVAAYQSQARAASHFRAVAR